MNLILRAKGLMGRPGLSGPAFLSTIGVLVMAQTDLPGRLSISLNQQETNVVVRWNSFPGKFYNLLTSSVVQEPAPDTRTNRIQAQTTISRVAEASTNAMRFFRLNEEPVAVASGPITANTIQEAEHLAGLNFTDAQARQVLEILQNGIPWFVDGEMLALKGWESIRRFPLRNGDAPALIFDPKPPGFVVNTAEQPISLSPPSVTEPPGDPNALAFYSVRDLGELIRTRKITSTQLTQLYLERLKRHNSSLFCVVTLTEQLALQQAQRADQEIAAGNYRGPLHGIPYGVKDLIAVAGYPTTWGAAPFRDQVINQNATVVSKLEAAGAVLVAKLATGTFASGDRWFGGQTRNPWNPNSGSGGSSAGPAAATAAGLVAFAIGTETMGSIVDPSAHCRVTGLRPTFGRVSRTGVMSFSWSMDKVGPICRTVEDCAIVLDAIRGVDPEDRSTIQAAFGYQAGRALGGVRVGYFAGQPTSSMLATLGSLVGENNLIPITAPDFPTGAMLSIQFAEASAAFDELTRSGGLDLLGMPDTYQIPNLFRTARTISAVDYLRANRVREKLVRELGELFKTIDLYVMPYTIDKNLAAANLAGLPCVGIPHGDGTSLLFVGRLYDEATLLAVANAYQRATGHHLERPPLFVN